MPNSVLGALPEHLVDGLEEILEEISYEG